jgi:predicted ABC-type transport system involved in lysophospholipase L1 biosynthesis ATPase subunit
MTEINQALIRAENRHESFTTDGVETYSRARMSHRMRHRFALSPGGQQRRVAVARVAVAATVHPAGERARRAPRTGPMIALRHEEE